MFGVGVHINLDSFLSTSLVYIEKSECTLNKECSKEHLTTSGHAPLT